MTLSAPGAATHDAIADGVAAEGAVGEGGAAESGTAEGGTAEREIASREAAVDAEAAEDSVARGVTTEDPAAPGAVVSNSATGAESDMRADSHMTSDSHISAAGDVAGASARAGDGNAIAGDVTAEDAAVKKAATSPAGDASDTSRAGGGKSVRKRRGKARASESALHEAEEFAASVDADLAAGDDDGSDDDELSAAGPDSSELVAGPREIDD